MIKIKGSYFDEKLGKLKEGYKMTYDKIKAFRLEPYGRNLGLISIDGERYPTGRV